MISPPGSEIQENMVAGAKLEIITAQSTIGILRQLGTAFCCLLSFKIDPLGLVPINSLSEAVF